MMPRTRRDDDLEDLTQWPTGPFSLDELHDLGFLPCVMRTSHGNLYGWVGGDNNLVRFDDQAQPYSIDLYGQRDGQQVGVRAEVPYDEPRLREFVEQVSRQTFQDQVPAWMDEFSKGDNR